MSSLPQDGPLASNKELYPELSIIMYALQEEGTPSKGGKITYKLLYKLAKELYDKLKDSKIPGLTNNASRGTNVIINTIITLRKLQDVATILPELRVYAKPQTPQMYIVANNLPFGGFNIVLNSLENLYTSKVKTSKVLRTPNDGLRVTGLMLLEKYRGTVSGMIKNTKDRKKSDQPMDPMDAFFEELAMDFNDKTVIIQHPRLVTELEDSEMYDPNDESRIQHNRDGAWVKETWRSYVKPKYRNALKMWNKRTGNGDGKPSNFVNYCDNDLWICWVYLLDEEKTGGLLASGTEAMVPSHLQNEVGFDNDADNNEVIQLFSSAGKNKCSSQTKLMKKIDTTGDKISGLIDTTSKVVAKMESILSQRTEKTDFDSPGTVTFNKLEKLNKRKAMIEDDVVFSPDTKRTFLDKINKEKTELIKSYNNSMKYTTPNKDDNAATSTTSKKDDSSISDCE